MLIDREALHVSHFVGKKKRFGLACSVLDISHGRNVVYTNSSQLSRARTNLWVRGLLVLA